MNEEEKETTKEQSAAQALIENTEEIVDTAAEEEKAEPVSPVKEDADDENKIFRKYKIKDIVFSFDKVLNFDGETSPYVQYTHARCASVLRKAGAPAAEPDLRALSSDEAYETVKAVLSFEDAVRSAARYREPCYVTRYAVDLAEKFNRFYYAERIITEDEAATAAKLALTDAVARTLRAALSLIGIKAPDEM